MVLEKGNRAAPKKTREPPADQNSPNCTYDYISGIKQHIKLVVLHFRGVSGRSHVSRCSHCTGEKKNDQAFDKLAMFHLAIPFSLAVSLHLLLSSSSTLTLLPASTSRPIFSLFHSLFLSFSPSPSAAALGAALVSSNM